MVTVWLLLGLCWAASMASPTSDLWDSSTSSSSTESRGFRLFKWFSDSPVQNLFQGSAAEVQTIPGIYDTVCSGSSSESYPSGSCVNLATCLFGGGAAAPDSRDCGAFEGICCTHRLSCDDTMTSRVAYWESKDYPQLDSKRGSCTLTIRPIRNACYIRVEFEDTLLTSPRADTCEGNTLTIAGQKEGTSGVLCGSLKGTETLVKVTEGMTGPFRVYDDVTMHMDIQDNWHKYKIKLTQIKCSQDVVSPVRLTRRGRAMGGLWLSPTENANGTVNPDENFSVKQIRNSLGMIKLLKQRQTDNTEATVNKESLPHAGDFEISRPGSLIHHGGHRLRLVKRRNDHEQRKQQNVEIPASPELLHDIPSNHLGVHSGDQVSERQIASNWWQGLATSFPQIAQMFDSDTDNGYMEFFQGVQPLRTGGKKVENSKNNVKGCKYDDPNLCNVLGGVNLDDTDESRLISTNNTDNKNTTSAGSFIDVQASIESANEPEINQRLTSARANSASKPKNSADAIIPGESGAVLPSNNTDPHSGSQTTLGTKDSGRVIAVRKAAPLQPVEELAESENPSLHFAENPLLEAGQDRNVSASEVETGQAVPAIKVHIAINELNVTGKLPEHLETTAEGELSQDNDVTTLPANVTGIRARIAQATNTSNEVLDKHDGDKDTNYASRMGGGYNGASLRHVPQVNFVQPEYYESSLSALSDSLLSMIKSREQMPRNEHGEATYSDDAYEYFRDVGIGSLSLDDRSRQVYEFHPPGEWRPSSISKIQASPSPPKVYELSLTEVLARMPQHKLERYALDLQKHSELSEDLLLQKLNELVFGEIQARNPFPRRMYGEGGGQFESGQQKQALVTSDNGFAILVSPIRSITELSNPQVTRNHLKTQNHLRESSNNFQYPSSTDSNNYQETLTNLNRFSNPNSGINNVPAAFVTNSNNNFQNSNPQNVNFRPPNSINNNYQNSFSNIQNKIPTRNDFEELLETVNILQNTYTRNENNYKTVPESSINMRQTFDGVPVNSANNYPSYPESSSSSQASAFVGALSAPQQNPIRFNAPPTASHGQTSQVHLPSTSIPSKFNYDASHLLQISADNIYRTEKEASYYGFMVLKNEAEEYFFCSATLISALHALTAASCVLRKGYAIEQYRTHVVFSNDDLGPPSGRSGASLFNHPNHKRVRRVVFHPMYKHGNFHYDLAVLVLESEVANSKPIKMALPDVDVRDRPITLMGHGARPSPRLTFDAYEQHLTYISARYQNFDTCSENYESSKTKRFSYLEKLIKPEMLCLLSSEGTQLCEGDQGGPVVIDFMVDKKEPQLVGLASGNNNNCINVARSELGVYPDLAVRFTWPIIEFIEMATSDFNFRE